MPVFRVHFEVGLAVTVEAATPEEARQRALALHDGIVTKVKRMRERANG